MQPPFMLHVLVPLIAGFRARYPEVELELNSNEGIIGVLKDSTLHARPVGISRIRVLAGLGIVCLSDFMTRTDREQGNLVQLLDKQTLDICQPVNAVYYRNTALAARITCFVDHVVETLGSRPFGT